MDVATLRAERLRSHRLSAPAATVGQAATHLLATQAQEFWGGRWALAVRTRGAPTLSVVDSAFDAGELLRSWTMRGTIHVIPARDLAWVLSVTGERQFRQAAGRHRALGLDHDTLDRAERTVRAALSGGNRLTRTELFALLEGIGIEPTGQRGVHVIYALAVRGVICQGPVVPRAAGPTREQYLVLTEEWVVDAAAPTDPLAELFVRYIVGHGPAGAADFAWWAGLPLGSARVAAEASAGRLDQVEDGLFLARPRPRRAPVPAVLALPPFEEFYISYADRSVACAPQNLSAIGPGVNGMVRPILLADGEIIGTWRSSTAVGRRRDHPALELFSPSGAIDANVEADVAAALRRFAMFLQTEPAAVGN